MIQLFRKINSRRKINCIFYVVIFLFVGLIVNAQALPTGSGGMSSDLFPSGGDSSSVGSLDSASDSVGGNTGTDSATPQSTATTKPNVQSIVELPYGGIRTLTIPCTCHSSPSKALVTMFDFVQLRYLKLAYMPKASVLYMYFDIWSSYYLLGSYNPYVRGTCLMTVTGGDCEPVPDDGLMGGLPGTGTSEPGLFP